MIFRSTSTKKNIAFLCCSCLIATGNNEQYSKNKKDRIWKREMKGGEWIGKGSKTPNTQKVLKSARTLRIGVRSTTVGANEQAILWCGLNHFVKDKTRASGLPSPCLSHSKRLRKLTYTNSTLHFILYIIICSI